MEITEQDVLLVTGATGLVGSHLVEAAHKRGLKTRAIVRPTSDTQFLDDLGVELVTGDLSDAESLKAAMDGVTLVVHCAAKVGDWGPVSDYRAVNVGGVKNLLAAMETAGTVRRMVHVSSLGVYPAKDHFGTDETTPISTTGIDGYTVSKAETEQAVRQHIDEHNLPAIILRPGFIYGPRDRTVFPRIMERLKSKQFRYLGSRDKLINNTYVSNLVDAIFLALESEEALGETLNITDARLVSKEELVAGIAEGVGYHVPTRTVPLPIAKGLARLLEGTYRLVGAKHAPILSSARIKFLGLNLDYSIEKARRVLGYAPAVDFQEGLQNTLEWYRQHDMVP
ncbi:NAD-dependent epimerase/dehydratase family protein [Thalassoroseus pseudoceratinae]|uniref:NAD-dependent epimerase/dehydratase family protein n=1 Tax=Thalassoroseus pseudoceratinae TaxID=2713176 RepID=UPI001422A073|nr:NAD-dependent epimerase/dehydratase family protein [Thalassoroseus pseudoceratinae]